MARFFISYSRGDKEVIRKIIALLRADGHEVWWDADIPSMADWWATILERIEWCEVFVFFASERSIQSPYCLAELGYAADRQRPVLPVILDDPTQLALPDRLPARAQWLIYSQDSAEMLIQINRAYQRIDWRLHRDITTRRPAEPGKENVTRQFQRARQMADSLQFDESKRLFQDIKRLAYDEWGADCDEWLARINSYAEVMDYAADVSTWNRAVQRWARHIDQHGDEFDPDGLIERLNQKEVKRRQQAEALARERLEALRQEEKTKAEALERQQHEQLKRDQEQDERRKRAEDEEAERQRLELEQAQTEAEALEHQRLEQLLWEEEQEKVEQYYRDAEAEIERQRLEQKLTEVEEETLEPYQPEQSIEEENHLEQTQPLLFKQLQEELQKQKRGISKGYISNFQELRRWILVIGFLFSCGIIGLLYSAFSELQQNANSAATRTAFVALNPDPFSLTVTHIIAVSTDTALANTQRAIGIATATADVFVDRIPTYQIATDSIIQSARTSVTSNAAWTPSEREFDGVAMVLVPAGCFDMGSAAGEEHEQPVHRICFSEPFWLDKTEVTQAQFEAKGGTKANPNRFTGDNRPVENITWQEAETYCRERRGARLPTEAEWEYAARGPDSWIYPWEDFWVSNGVNGRNSGDQTAQVGSRPAGASWVGALDLSGNVAEWTSSLYQEYPYDPQDGRENLTGTDVRVVRGGSFMDWDQTTMSYRMRIIGHIYWIGFRCARSS